MAKDGFVRCLCLCDFQLDCRDHGGPVCFHEGDLVSLSKRHADEAIEKGYAIDGDDATAVPRWIEPPASPVTLQPNRAILLATSDEQG